MLDALAAYVPEDRRQAIARREAMPEQVQGAALFADISGSTSLSEMLVQHYGPQRGAEELTALLDRVYDTLIQQLHQYQGSVIGFSGDAITCWLDQDDGRRAIAAALGMQSAMKQLRSISFPNGKVSLAVKVAVVVGNGLRLLVGDPVIQRMDVMGGFVVEHLAVAAQMVHSGEVIVDAATADRFAEILTLSEQRLIQVTLGKKANYLYGSFGAPIVHEDDARRALAAAIELNSPPEALSFIHPVRIGLSRGTMRTGPSGSPSRRSYSVLGDEANVAARLMEAAARGKLLSASA